MKTKTTKTLSRSHLARLLGAARSNDRPAAIAAINELLAGGYGKGWIASLEKLRAFLVNGEPRFSIFAENGNEKEPFLSFSALPGEGFCPGAGDCLQFCYSFKSWRYPAAFCRQVQNTFLLGSMAGWNAIRETLDTFNKPKMYNKAGKVDFRLYVDGDFRNDGDVYFWFTAISERPWLQAYGYSKSFNEILAAKVPAPKNYLLNVSGGHNHTQKTVNAIKALPITRGEFIAVSVGQKVKSADHGTRENNKVLRAAHGRKAFTCPGKCGACTPGGHACGSDKFRGVDIIIAVH